MPLQFSIKAYGTERIAQKFRTSAKQATNSRPAMQQVLRRIVEIERAIFDSQGVRGGGSWKNLSPKWQARKAAAGLDSRKLRASGALFRSLTSLQSSNMIRDINNYSLEFGSRLPYAALHQFGSDRIPARPYLKFTRRDRDDFVDIVSKHLTTAFGVKR